ncbi:unnamed protein product [Absidia cylindrospora]
MNELPAEIVSAIARTVPETDLLSLSLVNRQFYKVAHPLLWRDVALFSKPQLIKLLQCSLSSQHELLQHVRDLHLSVSISDDTLLLLTPMLSPLLDNLDLSEAKHITDESFIYIPRQCPHLTNVALQDAAITDKSIVSLRQHCLQLNSITLNGCRHLTQYVFGTLVGLPLDDVHVDQLGPHDDIDNGNFEPSRTMTLDFTRFPLLNELFLSFFDGYGFMTAVHPDGSYPTFPNLRRFHLHGNTSVEDDDIIRFIRRHPHLEELELVDSIYTDAVLDVIADTLSGLTVLELEDGDGFTTRGLRRVISQCPRLRSVCLSYSGFTYDDFPEIPFTTNRSYRFDNSVSFLKQDEIELIRRDVLDHSDTDGSNE